MTTCDPRDIYGPVRPCQACGKIHPACTYWNGDETASYCVNLDEHFFTSEQGRANRERREKA